MPHAHRSTAYPLSTFGWSFAGVIALSLSMPPVGFYPLAWVGLVPLLARWAQTSADKSYARETYALFLVAACTIAFWLLVHGDAGTALSGGFGLFLMPIPWVLAFWTSAWVRKQYGLTAGLTALTSGIVAVEFVVLHSAVSMPWMLLGHSQTAALPFLQIAALGGVSLLSLWVILLNVLAFLALPRLRTPSPHRWTGVFVGALAVMIALPPIYRQAAPSQSDSASGYTRMYVVQPGMSGSAWNEANNIERVDYLAEISASSLAAEPGESHRTVVWPASTIPRLGGPGSQTLMAKLRTWARRSGVTIISGATIENNESLTNAALLIEPGRPTVQYRQMRSVPIVDRAAVGGHEVRAGTAHKSFQTNGVKLAPMLGFEWIYGDHVRSTVAEGADALVVFPHVDQWGNSPGLGQTLSLLRLRAVESNRAVVVSGVSGGSALIRPSGEIEKLGHWMNQTMVGLQVPIHRDKTPYVRYGDWVGVIALVLALVLGLGAAVANQVLPGRFRPKKKGRPNRAPVSSGYEGRPANRRAPLRSALPG